MNNIDKRVVEMQFDNKQFEDGVQESVKSLENLKKGLDLEDSAKGLNAIEKAAKNIDLGRIADAAEAVADRFTFMGNIVQNVYNRISNAIIDVGLKMKGLFDSLTIQPITTGLQEYETQIDAIQTILSNTRDELTARGLSDSERLELVNSQLDQLNHYADKTIYNFTQMTRNIGTFTAAGIKLEDSVNAIQGIANLAAVSGSSSEQASRAMYQMSQALSTGTMKLQDWNSVVNAGMGGQLFQNALIRTAKARKKTVTQTVKETTKAGKTITKTVEMDVDQLIDKYGSFRDSLATGWLDKDVLTLTLEQMSWDFEQMAKDLGYTKENMAEGIEAAKEEKRAYLRSLGYEEKDIEDIISLAEDATDAATKVKTFTQLFDTLKEAAQSGWTETWELIIGDFEEAKALLTSISDYFGEIIGSAAEARNALVKGWKDLGGRDELIKSFWNIVYSIRNVVTTIKSAFAEIFPPATSRDLYSITKAFSDLTDRIRSFTENEENMDKLRRIIKGVASALDIVKQVIGGIWSGVKRIFSSVDLSATKDVASFIAGIADKITEFNQKLRESGAIKEIIDKVVYYIQFAFEKIRVFIDKIKGLFAIGPGGIVERIKEWFGGFSSIGDQISGFIDGNQVLTNIRTFLTGIWDTVKGFLANAKGTTIAGIIAGFLGVGLFVKIRNALNRFKGIQKSLKKGINDVKESITSTISSFKIEKDKDKETLATSILKIAASLALVAGSIYLIAQIEPDRLKQALLTMSGVLVALISVAFILSKIQPKQAKGIKKASVGLMFLGAAMMLFARAMQRLGEMDDVALAKGLVGLGGILLELAVFLALTKKAKFGVLKGAGLILLAASINLFANAIRKIGDLETEAIVKGIAGLGAVLLELAVFLVLTKKAKLGVFKGAGLILLAVSIKLFANAMEAIGRMHPNAIQKGLAGLGGILLELAVFLALTKKAKIGVFKSAGLILLAVSVKMFAQTMQSIGGLDTGTIAKGVAGLGAILMELAVFLALTKKAKLGVFKGASLILLAVAVKMFAQTMQSIGDLDPGTIIKGVAGLGAILLELAAFLALTKKAKIGVFKGVGLILLAVSVKMFAQTIQEIGGMETETVVRGVAGLGAVLLELAAFLALTKKAKLGVFKSAGLILLAVSINMFAKAIGEIGGFDTATVIKGVSGLGAVLLELAVFLALTKKAKIGVFQGAGLILIAVSMVAFGKAISGIGKLRTSTILKGVMGIGLILLELVGFIRLTKGIKASGMVKTLLVLIAMAGSLYLFAGAMQKLDGVDTGSILEFSASFGVALLAFSATMAILSALPVTAILAGIAKVALIIGSLMLVMAAFGALEQSGAGIVSAINSFGDITEAMGNSIGRFIGGIGAGIMKGLDLPTIGTDLSTFMTNLQPFLEGCKSIDESVLTGIGNLALALMAIGGAELVTAISSWFVGENPISKFANDIGTIATALNTFAANVVGFTTTDGFDAAIEAAKGLAGVMNALPSTGGLVQKITGAKDLSAFNDDIPAFATAMKTYATELGDFDKTITPESIKNSTDAAKGLVGIVNALPYAGGLKQKITGAPDFSGFVDVIPQYAEAMRTYAEELGSFDKTITTNSVTNSTSAAKGLIGLINALPYTGGLKQKITGAPDFSGFVDIIPDYAEAMQTYAEKLGSFDKTITTNSVTNSTSAAKGLIGLINALPYTGGLKQRITGAPDFSGFVDVIPNYAKAMQTYAEKLGTFDETINISSVNNSTKAAEGLIGLINTLPYVGGLKQKITGAPDFGGFVDVIPSYAEAMKTYAKNISGFEETVKPISVENSRVAAKGLIGLINALPYTGGLKQKITGAPDFGGFVDIIPDYAEAMKTYAEKLGSFDETITTSAVTNSTTAAMGLVGIIKALPYSGGLSDKIVGAPDFSGFIDKIPSYASAMNTYAEQLGSFDKTITSASVKNSTSAALGLVDIIKALPNEGGLDQAISGAPDFSDFVDKIPSYASAMSTYANELSGFTSTVTEADITNSTNAALGLVGIVNALPREGGWLDNIVGTKNLSTFSADIPKWAEAMKAYAENIGGFSISVTTDDVTNATNAAMGLVGLKNALPQEGGWLDNIVGTHNLSTFSADIPTWSEAMTTYAENIGGFSTSVTTDDVTNATNAAMGLVGLKNALPQEGGWLDNIAGTKNLSTFSADIPKWSEAMTAYAENIGGFSNSVTTEDVTNATNAAMGLVSLKNALPQEGGWLDNIVGTHNLSTFSADIPIWAGAMTTYADNIGGFSTSVTTEDVTNATNAAMGLVSLKNALPKESEWAKAIFGTQSLSAFSADIPTWAGAMKTYAEQLGGFTESVSSDDIESSTNAAMGLVNLRNALPKKGGWSEAILGASSMQTFADDVPTYAAAMQTYAEGISGFSTTADENDINNATTAANGIAALITALPKTGGVMDSLVGTQDLSTFADNVGLYAESLKTYATSISGFSTTADENDINNATTAANGIAALMTALPKTGGVADALVGAQSLETFAGDVPIYAKAMQTYAEGISGFSTVATPEDVEGANTAAAGITAFRNAIPKSNIFERAIIGSSDLQNFADEVPQYASAMMAYATGINGFSELASDDDIRKSNKVAKGLADLMGTLPKEGGWVQNIMGTQDLGSFSSKCAQLGEGLASFASNIGSVSIENTENAVTAMGIIQEFMNGVNTEGGIFNAIGEFFGGSSDIVGLSEKMATVGLNLNTFATKLSGLDFTNVTSATGAMTQLQELQNTLASNGGVFNSIGEFFGGAKDITVMSGKMATFGTDFKTFADGIKGASKAQSDFTIVGEVINAFKTLAMDIGSDTTDYYALERSAEILADIFVGFMTSTITNGTTNVSNAATNLAVAGVNAARATYTSWVTAGLFLGSGLAAGINARQGSVNLATHNLTMGAVRTVKDDWDENSPSKVGAELGMYFDLGIAQGLDGYSKVVNSSMSGMSQNALDSARTLLRGADQSIFDDIDPNPTIRPVLDLTNVRNGVGAIGGMLNSDQIVESDLFRGINFSRGVRTLEFDGAKIAGGLNNRDVVSELRTLETRFDNLNQAMSNMQIVLDSGELVGATSGKMDDQLGTLAMRRGRGN